MGAFPVIYHDQLLRWSTVDETTEKPTDSQADQTGQTLLKLYEAGETEPPEFWWRARLDL